MRTLGAAVLGLFLGLIAGALLTSAVARPLVDSGAIGDGHVSTGTGILLGMIMPVLGICGLVVAILIERHVRRDA